MPYFLMLGILPLTAKQHLSGVQFSFPAELSEEMICLQAQLEVGV